MRFTFIAVLAGAMTVAAEQAPPVTFRSSVTLVSVDVSVLDKDGRPVSGLTADDFQIKLNGKLQPIRTVSFIRVAEPPEAVAPPVVADAGRRHVVTNAVPSGDRKIFIVAVDDLSFPPEGGRRTMAAARRFADAQPADVFVGVTTTSGAVVVNPTLDRTAVADGLKRVVGGFIDPRKPSSPTMPSVGITEAIEISEHNNTSVRDAAVARECADAGRAIQSGEYGLYSNAIGMYNTKCSTDLMAAARLIASQTQGTTQRQISSLSNTLAAMRGAPGLKQMMVVSQGIATTREFLSLFEPVTRTAAAAGVQLSVLMEDEDDGDVTNQAKAASELGQSIKDTGLAARRREDRRMFAAALQSLADVSGGTFERMISNPDGAFKRAAIAGSAVYRIGVEAPSDASASKPIEVSATVSRGGCSVHANRSAVLPGAVVQPSTAELVSAAIRRGQPAYAVPVRAAVTRRQAPDHQVEVGIGIEVPAAVAGPLKVTIGLINEAGELKQGARAVPAPGDRGDYRLTVPMPVAPGRYRVRLAVEDATGGVGSVDTEVDARLTAMGAVNVSDLLTWWKDGSGRPQFLALDDVPPGVTNLSAGIELYKPAGQSFPADLKVRLSLLAAGGSTPVAEVDLTPRADGEVLRAEATLPLASLAPGSYVIRATVTAGPQRLGDVSTTIRKN